ncbi:MAG: GNAT family N-acetyltransferase [Christensenellales bacterium]|jgi:ribosomal-protein-alanine N-acetyltransferase
MTITFKAIDKPDAITISHILYVEQEAFGDTALSEYVIVPLLRHGKVYIAVDEEDIVIACAYFIRDMHDAGIAYLMSVATLPVFKGHDVGTALLNFAFSDLKEIGIARLQLTVDPANFAALSTYREKLGFAVADNSQDEYGIGDDKLIMVRDL